MFSLQPGYNGKTPLMEAALDGCRETTSCLVDELGSDPDTLDSAGSPALYYALESNDQKIVEMLCPVTTAGEILRYLGSSPSPCSVDIADIINNVLFRSK